LSLVTSAATKNEAFEHAKLEDIGMGGRVRAAGPGL
jgi:hypothetical protein